MNFFLRNYLITPILSVGRYRKSIQATNRRKGGARREGKLFKRKEKELTHTHRPRGGKAGFIL